MMARRKASRERPRAFAWATRFAPASGGSSSVIVMAASFNIVPLRQRRGKYRLARTARTGFEMRRKRFSGAITQGRCDIEIAGDMLRGHLRHKRELCEVFCRNGFEPPADRKSGVYGKS